MHGNYLSDGCISNQIPSVGKIGILMLVISYRMSVLQPPIARCWLCLNLPHHHETVAGLVWLYCITQVKPKRDKHIFKVGIPRRWYFVAHHVISIVVATSLFCRISL